MSGGTFPTDELTLRLLIEACRINPDTERSHLQDFLMMGTEERSRELIEDGAGTSFAAAPVYLVEYEEGREPVSEQEVIIALATELLALRAALPRYTGESEQT